MFEAFFHTTFLDSFVFRYTLYPYLEASVECVQLGYLLSGVSCVSTLIPPQVKHVGVSRMIYTECDV